MERKPLVDQTQEDSRDILPERIKSGNVSETSRRRGIAPTLFYRGLDGAEQGAKAAPRGRSAAAGETEKDRRI
jgi:transposase-like protein